MSMQTHHAVASCIRIANENAARICTDGRTDGRTNDRPPMVTILRLSNACETSGIFASIAMRFNGKAQR